MGRADADVTLAPGAEDNELAAWVVERLRAQLELREPARRDLRAMRAAIAMVAPDRQLQCTLRFDHGHVAVHDGMLGVPDVTFCADYEVMMGLGNLPLSRLGRLPLPPLSRAKNALWRRSAMELLTGELKIYGLLEHPRLVTRMLRLLAP